MIITTDKVEIVENAGATAMLRRDTKSGKALWYKVEEMSVDEIKQFIIDGVKI